MLLNADLSDRLQIYISSSLVYSPILTQVYGALQELNKTLYNFQQS